MAVDLDMWLEGLSPEGIACHWQVHPEHEVAFVLGEDHVVFGCNTPEAEEAMSAIEARCGLQPQLVLKSERGTKRLYRLPRNSSAKRTPLELMMGYISVHGIQDLVAWPPAEGMAFAVMDVSNVKEVTEASQELLDEVFAHNTHLSQRQTTPDASPELEALPKPKTPEIAACIDGVSYMGRVGLPPPAEGVVRPPASPLAEFSLLDHGEEVERHVQEQRPLLGDLALMGQATVLYARPGTGKTLIVLYLLVAAIAKGAVHPDRVFYLNMDDNAKGLAEKLQLAAEYRFHMLADGHRNFDVSAFSNTMYMMVREDKVDGAIVILDTLKKFVNLMDKARSSSFTRLARQFVMKGGTIVALAHANKHPSADGKVIYSGTADIVDDFDCAYTIDLISKDTDVNQCVIEFTNIKRRGDVALSAAYGYTLERQLSYAALLSSVQPVEADAVLPIKAASAAEDDRAVIDAVLACLAEGVDTKMLLAASAAKKASVGKHTAVAVIERYTGDEPGKHRWRYVVRARGAKVFQALPDLTPNRAP